MAIKVVCDICGELHKVRDERRGAQMYCKTCDNPCVVPNGPWIPDDEELVEEESEEDEPAADEGVPWFDMTKSLVGAAFGLVLMGFYVSFTVSFLTGAEGSSTRAEVDRGPGGSIFRPPSVATNDNRPAPPLPGTDRRPPGVGDSTPPERVDPPAVTPDAEDEKPTRIHKLVVSPADGLVATGHDDGAIRIWNTSGRLRNTLDGHANAVTHLRFTPEGTRLLSLGGDNVLRVWDVGRGRLFGEVPVPNVRRTPIAVTAGGRRAAVADTRGGVHFIDTVDLKVVDRVSTGDRSPRDFVGEDRLLVLGRSGSWKLIGEKGLSFGTGLLGGRKSMATGAASSTGLLALTVNGDEMFLWDSEAKRRREPIAVEFPVYFARFSPTGAFVVFFGGQRRLAVYDVSVDPARKVFDAENVHVGAGFHAESELVYAAFDQNDPGTPRITTHRLPRPAGTVARYVRPDPLPSSPTVSPTPPATPTTPVVTPQRPELVTDVTQPIVITSLQPTTVQPGTELVVRGKGFEKTQAIAFGSFRTRTDPQMAVRDFRVVSDREIRVTVPQVVTRQTGGTVVEIYTPEGVGVTWPETSQVLKNADDEPEKYGFVFVSRGLKLSERPRLANVFLDEGSSVEGLSSTRAYVRERANVGNTGSSNGIVASQGSTVRVSFERDTSANAPDVFPSFLPKVLNQK